MILNQLNFHDFDFDLKSFQIWFYFTQHWQNVFKRYHSHKHFSEFYIQDGGKNQLA